MTRPADSPKYAPATDVLVSPRGEVLAGDGPRHIKYPIHTEIMPARPDVGAVVHAHSAAGCEFAALEVPLRPLDQVGALFCYPSIPRSRLPHQDLGARAGGGG